MPIRGCVLRSGGVLVGEMNKDVVDVEVDEDSVMVGVTVMLGRFMLVKVMLVNVEVGTGPGLGWVMIPGPVPQILPFGQQPFETQ